MGMAASQARYLALTARKTNTEWEGQQINQARTALANQSANLFNRLLNMEVPNAPKTTDYTTLQYSYSDGDNDSVLEEWHQLSDKNAEYNYEVKHYYYADIFTGSQKQLADPQVQVGDVLKEIQYYDDTAQITYGSDGVTVKYIVNKEEVTKKYSKITDTQVAENEHLRKSLTDFETAKGRAIGEGVMPDTENVYGYEDKTTQPSTWHFYLANIKQDESGKYVGESVDKKDYSMAYHEPKFVGNSKLNELNELIVNDKIDQVSDIAQILRDCPTSSMNKYAHFDGEGNLVYDGQGIYTFDLNGKSYYTTSEDLWNSIGEPYDETKPIDNQGKLAYYNAVAINKKIETSNKALLETDGNGRFKSVKFDNDSVVYDLNVETVTDQAAYQDAMNKYLHEKDVYEKTIADINAKTSIIQKEDRTLELRLKQLDTEQHALATEMDAVKKVIKDNVEKTFKTFSD